MFVVNRSTLPPCDYRYSVETQAPAGNWVVGFRCNDLALATAQADHMAKVLHCNVRVVDEHQ